MADRHDKFKLSLRAFAKKAGANADLVIRKLVLDMGTRIVMRSPVGDPSNWASPAPKGYIGGHFRANWQYSYGAPLRTILPDIDKGGQQTVDRLAASLPPKMSGLVHFLSNNLPYGPALETGWSKQAPAGMVGITMREVQMIINRATREVKAK